MSESKPTAVDTQLAEFLIKTRDMPPCSNACSDHGVWAGGVRLLALDAVDGREDRRAMRESLARIELSQCNPQDVKDIVTEAVAARITLATERSREARTRATDTMKHDTERAEDIEARRSKMEIPLPWGKTWKLEGTPASIASRYMFRAFAMVVLLASVGWLYGEIKSAKVEIRQDVTKAIVERLRAIPGG